MGREIVALILGVAVGMVAHLGMSAVGVVSEVQGVLSGTPAPAAPKKAGAKAPEPRQAVPVKRLDGVGEAACEQGRRTIQAEQASLRTELDRATTQLALQTGILEQREGREQPWPADLDVTAHADDVEDEVAAVLEGLEGDFEVHEVDCSEDPCLVAVVEHLSKKEVAARDGSTQSNEALAKALWAAPVAEGSRGTSSTWAKVDGRQQMVHVFDVGAVQLEADDFRARRIDWRSDQFSAELGAR